MEISSLGIMAERDGELETEIRKHKPFRYEAAWDNGAECGELIQREWLCNLNPNFSLPSAMERLQRGDKKEELQQLKQEIDGLLEEDDIKWKQKAKQQWLKDGDRNTKFFHLCANQHRKSNVIKQISSDDGRFANKPEEDLQDLMDYLAIFYQKHWMIIGPSVCAVVRDAFLAFEVMHTMNTSLKGKDGYMVLKLDMSKAYDRLEWSFLQAVMLKMGFNPTWIKVIMNYLSPVTYLVLINGISQKPFKPSRGIRQGDPLSPYLFIIGAETLSRLIQDAEDRRVIKGGQKNDESRIHWCSWDKMKLSKTNDGLGFKDLELFNLAMLTKQGWRLLHYPNSFAARVLSAKYYPEVYFLEAKVKRTSSFIWRSVMAARPILESGLMWHISDGSKARIWQDKWLPSPSSFKIQSQCLGMDLEAKVATLIDPQSKSWKLDMLKDLFSESEVSTICQIPISVFNRPDKLV
ncbi:hypothetical protein Patl1_12097 [Pistacia atlantica]|uniref:Uncharacterized protein n=1 Tax=Pistacia atlantica TaxID=434234 RepID=A0ACC1A2Y3_9ROSI|nr:hypothetical protein Patl1_12097 [Pistacia atlantica]